MTKGEGTISFDSSNIIFKLLEPGSESFRTNNPFVISLVISLPWNQHLVNSLEKGMRLSYFSEQEPSLKSKAYVFDYRGWFASEYMGEAKIIGELENLDLRIIK